MAEPLKLGDVVQLKSGGPHMTVVLINRGDTGPLIWCNWFSEDAEVRQDNFPPEALNNLTDELEK